MFLKFLFLTIYIHHFNFLGNNDMIHDYQPPVDWGNFFYESYAKIMMRYIFISDDVIDHNAKTDFVDTFKVGGFYKIYLKGIYFSKVHRQSLFPLQ